MVYLGELPAVNSATQGFGLYFKGNSKALKILNRGQADQENRVVFRNFPETLLWRVGWRESRRLRNGAEVVRLSCCLFRWEIGRCGKGNHRINEGRDYVPFDCLSCMGFTVHTCKWMNEWSISTQLILRPMAGGGYMFSWSKTQTLTDTTAWGHFSLKTDIATRIV